MERALRSAASWRVDPLGTFERSFGVRVEEIEKRWLRITEE
jgi:hypothetical protein